MTIYRLPLLVWRDAQGGYTAAPSSRIWVNQRWSALLTRQPARRGKYDRIWTWILKQHPWQVPDFLDASLVHVRVSVRPEYRAERRIYPCPEQVELQVPCVVGRQQSGLFSVACRLWG